MGKRSVGMVLACLFTAAGLPAQAEPPAVFQFESGAAAAAVQSAVTAGRQRVEGFFGDTFHGSFRVIVADSRAGFDKTMPAAWGMTPTQCWMVGVGVADWLAILSPSAWRTEACEHDGEDPQEVRDIVAHELTHSFHAQRNPTRDFTGMDDMAWFVEGLATHVSGQLDRPRALTARAAIEAGAAPADLESAWKGKHRYGVSGSMVAYIEATYGRPVLTRLLGATTESELLGVLGVTEAEFLKGWRAWVLLGPASG